MYYTYFGYARLGYQRVIIIVFMAILSTLGISINSQVSAQITPGRGFGQETRNEEIEKAEEEARKARLEADKAAEEARKARIEADKATEEARKARAEADKATEEVRKAKTSLPQIDTSKARQGSVTIQDSRTPGLTFENQVLAYRAMESVADKIQTEIVNKLGSNISLVISDPEAVPTAFAQLDYQIFKDRVDAIQVRYKELGVITLKNRFSSTRNSFLGFNSNNSSINPTNAATASFLFNLLPLFKVDQEIKETDAGITVRDFVAQLGGKFREDGKSRISVYYPYEYPLITRRAINDVLKEINTLQKLQNLGKKRLPFLSFTNQAKLQQLNQEVQDLIDSLLDKDINTAKNLLGAIASSRALQLIMGSDKNAVSNKTYFLSVKIIAKGTQKITKTFLNSRLRHSGGVIVKYIIYDRNASIVLSNVHHAYTGFTKVRSSQ